MYLLTIDEFIVIISVPSYPFAFPAWFVRGLGMLQNIKNNAPQFEDELDRNATVHSHKVHNDNPTGDLISII